MNQAFVESKKKSDAQVAEMAKQTVSGAIEMCAAEAQDATAQSTVSLAIRSVIENILDEEVHARHTQRAAMREVVRPSMIGAVSDALLKHDNLMAAITTIVSSCVEKKAKQCHEGRRFD